MPSLKKCKKRGREDTDPNSPQSPSSKSMKQLRIDDLLIKELLSNLMLPTHNRFSPLDQEETLPPAPNSSQSPGSSLDLEEEADTRADMSGQALCHSPAEPTGSFSHGGLSKAELIKIVGDHCLLTAETVVKIFQQLNKISCKLEELSTLLVSAENLKSGVCEQAAGVIPTPLSTGSGLWHPSSYNSSSRTDMRSNLVLSKKQVALVIARIPINFGRWSNRKEIICSLNLLLKIPPCDIALKQVERLPDTNAGRRLVLSFASSTIPHLLFKSKVHLASFQVQPVRVFQEENRRSLNIFQIHVRGLFLEEGHSKTTG